MAWRAFLYARPYDKAAFDAAFTAGRDPPRVDYTEPTLCGVSSWVGWCKLKVIDTRVESA